MNKISKLNNLKQSFDDFTPSILNLYKPWTHEQPIMVGGNRIEAMHLAQKAMLKLMTFIAEHYSGVSHLLPHDAEIKQFLGQLEGIQFQAGTFRTDFVVDDNDEMRLIEVTCRYPLNGYLRSPAMNQLCDAKKFADVEGLSITEMQLPIIDKLHNWMGNTRRFCILQGEDNRGNESNHLPEIFEKAGYEVLHIGISEWCDNWKNYLEGSAIMAELTFEEWLDLPIDMVKSMLSQPFLNDPRLIFTVHDKGFFALINEESLVRKILSKSEIDLLKQIFAETYLPAQASDKWREAKEKQSQWMLKPRKLGRSVNIIAGSLTSKEGWLEAINNASDNEMILQRWYQSKKISGSIAAKQYDDFFAGTLLYWGGDFFGPGMFRMSSHPISNVVDDRKATFLIDLEHDSSTHPHLSWL